LAQRILCCDFITETAKPCPSEPERAGSMQGWPEAHRGGLFVDVDSSSAVMPTPQCAEVAPLPERRANADGGDIALEMIGPSSLAGH
jgi:hypothetical protein